MKLFKDPLSREEETHYLKLFKEGDQRAKDVLVEHNLRLVAHIVKRYVSPERDMEDLISIGTIGLIKGIESFDASKGKLSTYAAKCIDNEMLMYLRSERKKSKEVSIYDPIGTDNDGNEICLYDVIISDDNNVEALCELDGDIKNLRIAIKEQLTPKERFILSKRYGLDGGKNYTQREIANLLGISRSYVSRIEKRILEKLRSNLENV